MKNNVAITKENYESNDKCENSVENNNDTAP